MRAFNAGLEKKKKRDPRYYDDIEVESSEKVDRNLLRVI